MNHKHFFMMAKEIAQAREDDGRQFFHGAVGLRKDGLIVCASNIRSPGFIPGCHAETRLSRKMDKGGVVYVVRVRRMDGSFANSRPCQDCLRAMSRMKIRRVYYSISDNEYGVIDKL